MDSGRLLTIQLRALADRLKAGRRYTADELRLALIDVLALDKSINLDAWRPDPADQDAVAKVNRRAVDLLRTFFEIKRNGKKTQGDGIEKALFILDKIRFFDSKKTTFFNTTGYKSKVYNDSDGPLLENMERAVFTYHQDDECPF
jgi:hypothetical protein